MKKSSPWAAAVAATLLFTLVATVVVRNAAVAEDQAKTAQPDKAAVDRARKNVQMLDNIYKNAVVLITDKYVHDEDDFAAGSAAVLLFENVSKSGTHQVRLLDATGEPYDNDNVAKDDFEREGIKQMKAGNQLYEQIVQIEGKPQLRAMTPVPVVLKKCTMCHDHYNDVAEGEAIGAISYTIPIE